MVTLTINIPPMLAHIPYMDPMEKAVPKYPPLALNWLSALACSQVFTEPMANPSDQKNQILGDSAIMALYQL